MAEIHYFVVCQPPINLKKKNVSLTVCSSGCQLCGNTGALFAEVIEPKDEGHYAGMMEVGSNGFSCRNLSAC